MRHAGQDHFNARNPGKITRKKRRDKELSKSFHKTVKILTNTLISPLCLESSAEQSIKKEANPPESRQRLQVGSKE